VICERYETIVVPFPFSDIPIMKRRPAVVLSSSLFNEQNGATIMAMITTAKESSWPSDVQIVDLKSAGLQTSCVIRWKLATIPNALILRALGMLSAGDSIQCDGQFTEIIK
jgi:mRNA interferase MazF